MLELKQITVLPTLMRWRIEVLRSLSGREPHPRLLVVTRQYFREHIADGSHVAFVAEVNGVECGCGSICLADELPTPDNPTGRYASLVNIYVCEPYRNQGFGMLYCKASYGRSRETGDVEKFISKRQIKACCSVSRF